MLSVMYDALVYGTVLMAGLWLLLTESFINYTHKRITPLPIIKKKKIYHFEP